MSKFGTCSYCGGILRPIYFIREEELIYNGQIIKTGRKCKAVSHLVCENCLMNEIVDDSFDGDWYK